VPERIRIVFCGTPSFAVPTFRHLLRQTDIAVAGVITQPDRPRGRGQQVSFSAVKQAALAAKIAVHQPEKIRAPEVQELLQALAPDGMVIIAYGQIIPARLLPIPKLGWINLHASLLPKYRGAAPINWAIVNGETQTGVTTMRIDAGMDTGDMLLQREMEIGSKETAPELAARLSEAGAPLMAETLRGLAKGLIVPRPQNHTEASHAPMLKKEDGRIDWSWTAEEISRRVRGLRPWPGAYTTFRGKGLHVWSAVPVAPESRDALEPGTLVATPRQLLVACGQATLLHVKELQLQGRRRMPAPDFLNGVRLAAGEKFVSS